MDKGKGVPSRIILRRQYCLRRYWGWRMRPMYGDMRLLMKNMERMLRTRSSYSGLNQSKMNRKKGSNVVFRKNAAQFLYNFIDI